jgi:hypothetical protein
MGLSIQHCRSHLTYGKISVDSESSDSLPHKLNMEMKTDMKYIASWKEF